jgi:hypothetical protein
MCRAMDAFMVGLSVFLSRPNALDRNNLLTPISGRDFPIRSAHTETRGKFRLVGFARYVCTALLGIFLVSFKAFQLQTSRTTWPHATLGVPDERVSSRVRGSITGRNHRCRRSQTAAWYDPTPQSDVAQRNPRSRISICCVSSMLSAPAPPTTPSVSQSPPNKNSSR